MTMGTNLKVWLVGLVSLSAAVNPALVCGDMIAPSQYWKTRSGFPTITFARKPAVAAVRQKACSSMNFLLKGGVLR